MIALPDRNAANAARFDRHSREGHYESWFQRANHPSRPLAFWIRYTVFAPRGKPDLARGELWAIFFDGEQGHITAVKEELPIARCEFSAEGLFVRLGDASLQPSSLQGAARANGRSVSWDLQYTSPEPPLLLLPVDRYEAGFPKAKALVGSPLAVYTGGIQINGQDITVDDWVGSQNHNWGRRHTDDYAWGQVAGFDDAPDAFLEVTTARVRVGPLYTPFMTLAVLRLDGVEHRLNSLGRALVARGSFHDFDWKFSRRDGNVHIEGHIQAPRDAFAALRYDNPPGGSKICLNSKLARCELQVRMAGKPPRVLHTRHRAAFEMLSDANTHGLPVLA